MSVAVQTSFYQSYQYGSYGSKTNRGVADFDKEYIGKATSRTTSSNDGKNIGIMTIGSKGYIAKYADSSREFCKVFDSFKPISRWIFAIEKILSN